jgi:small subunit ribosomal protein S7
MSRKGISKPRVVAPDPIYNSITVAKLINACMKDGKRSAAQKQVYLAMDLIKKEVPSDDALVTLEKALDKIKPKVEVRPRRIGGAVYQVPTPVKSNRQSSLTFRWLITVTRAKSNKQFHTFGEKLASELLLALKDEGSTITKRLEIERMAEANKAFAHLRW